MEYEACLTKLKADSTSKDSAIKALQDNLSEEESRNEASLKKEHDATGDLKMKQKKEIETKDEAIRVMQRKIAEEKTKGESVINKLKKDLIKQTTISKSQEQKISQNKVIF